MPGYILSVSAEKDIEEIFDYSYKSFGKKRAVSYINALEECLNNLAISPLLGRKIDHIRKGYFSYQYISHKIYYKKNSKGILVIRILHNKMDNDKYLN